MTRIGTDRQGGATPDDTRPPDDALGPTRDPDQRERHFGIRILRDGTWIHEGRPIVRDRLVKLFATLLHLDPDGAYRLRTPVEEGRIDVDDAPFVAVALDVEGVGADQRLVFRTNLDERVVLSPADSLRVAVDPQSGEPAPYIHVRDGLEALIGRAVFYELADLAVERDGRFGVWSAGAFFPLDGAT